MPRRLLLCSLIFRFFFLPVLCFGADPCGPAYAHLVSREVVSHEVLRSSIEASTNDTLIRELELDHLVALRNDPGAGAKTWKKFYPMWIFEFPGTIERVLDHFDPVDGSNPKYLHGVKKWVEEWERVYTENYGEVTERWKNGGKEKFIQRLLVEAAVRYARRERLGGTPKIFLTQSTDGQAFVNELTAQIQASFKGNPDTFQKEFDRVYRQREGVGLEAAPSDVPRAEVDTRRQLRSIGADLAKLRTWQPRVAADFRKRKAESDIDLAVESVREFGESVVPLGGLLRSGTGAAAGEATQSNYDWSAMAAIVDRHGGVNPFLTKINQRLTAEGLPVITPQRGARTPAQELLVQSAVIAAVDGAPKNSLAFSGFQAEDPEQPHYIDMQNELVQRSGLGLRELNDLVRARLP